MDRSEEKDGGRKNKKNKGKEFVVVLVVLIYDSFIGPSMLRILCDFFFSFLVILPACFWAQFFQPRGSIRCWIADVVKVKAKLG